jgi:hypothetical protein
MGPALKRFTDNGLERRRRKCSKMRHWRRQPPRPRHAKTIVRKRFPDLSVFGSYFAFYLTTKNAAIKNENLGVAQ